RRLVALARTGSTQRPQPLMKGLDRRLGRTGRAIEVQIAMERSLLTTAGEPSPTALNTKSPVRVSFARLGEDPCSCLEPRLSGRRLCSGIVEELWAGIHATADLEKMFLMIIRLSNKLCLMPHCTKRYLMPLLACLLTGIASGDDVCLVRLAVPSTSPPVRMY